MALLGLTTLVASAPYPAPQKDAESVLCAALGDATGTIEACLPTTTTAASGAITTLAEMLVAAAATTDPDAPTETTAATEQSIHGFDPDEEAT